MMNLTTINNQNSENFYLLFEVGKEKYAVKTTQVLEIIKLPKLEYPQKLASNIVGLLNYNHLMISIVDLRFYLNKKVSPYTTDNQLIIVKTDESIFGILIDNVIDLIEIDTKKTEIPPIENEFQIIEFLYKRSKQEDIVSSVNLYSVENLIKRGFNTEKTDIQSLFPTDEKSLKKFEDRTLALENKFKFNIDSTIFNKNRFITFSMNDNLFCIDINYVKEFLKEVTITPIPCSANYVEGIINLRGNFISIINLKNFLELPDLKNKNTKITENQIIIIENESITVGFLVDKIFKIVSIDDEIIDKNSKHVMNKYIFSEVVLEDKLYTILNISNIFSDEKMFIEEK